MFVEREVCHQPFQTTVFFFNLAEPAQLAHTEVRVLFLPRVEGLLGDPSCRQRSLMGVPLSTWRRGLDDLLLREFRPLHGSTPFAENRRGRHSTLVLICHVVFRGDVIITS